MELTTDDRLAICELINLHGHLMDSGEFERLDELFSPDVAYDLTAYGRGILRGIDMIVAAAQALGDGNPLAHHVTNIVITGAAEASVFVVSKGIAVRSDGSCGSVVYHDEIRKVGAGWRIATRRVVPRREPLRA
jgi:hypothetical protein